MIRKGKYADRRVSDTNIETNESDLTEDKRAEEVEEEEDLAPKMPLRASDKSVTMASLKPSLSVASSCIIRHPKQRSTSPSPSQNAAARVPDDEVGPPTEEPVPPEATPSPRGLLGISLNIPGIRRVPSSAEVIVKQGKRPTTPRGKGTEKFTKAAATTPLQIKARNGHRNGERTARRLNKHESQSIRTQLSVMSIAQLKEAQNNIEVERAAVSGFVRNPHKKKEPLDKPREVAKVDDEEAGMELSVDNFTQLRFIGRGTYGLIKLVRYKKPPHGLFALKILDKRQQITENEVEHVMNESKLLKSLKFPFVVKHYGSFQDESRLYILMEYVTGSDLFTYIQEYRFDNDLVRFFSSQVVMLLEYLHLQDVVFRDLKPENLLIDWRGYLKLTDFSFAKEIPDQRTYTFCGTPCYMAPEIILQEGHGKGADWWALGILIYEMITGHPPFDKRDSVELYDDILMTEPSFDERFSATAQDLIRLLLEKDPDRRLGSKGAQEVKDHPFFDEIDWDSIFTRRTKSPLPSHVIDNPIDKTPLDSGFGDPMPLTAEEQKLFVGF